jgi:1-acylglycerone phosphate reductase
MTMAATRKSVLVTGCSEGGIGDALAQAFQRKGLHVFATARSLTKIAHLSTLPNVTCIALDVTSTESIQVAVKIVSKKTGGKLDYLINNAGLGIVSPAIDADIADARKMFDANFWGAVAMVQAFSELVISAKGTIGNVAALGAILHIPWMCMFSRSSMMIIPS